MASLAFNDGSAATLASTVPAPANRLRNWRAGVKSIGPGATALGTGARSQWRFRTDFTAALELPYLAEADTDVALRLIVHLLGGGTVTLATGDSASRSYTCTLQPDTEPSWTCEDRQEGYWTFACQLRNSAAAAMRCDYP